MTVDLNSVPAKCLKKEKLVNTHTQKTLKANTFKSASIGIQIVSQGSFLGLSQPINVDDGQEIVQLIMGCKC